LGQQTNKGFFNRNSLAINFYTPMIKSMVRIQGKIRGPSQKFSASTY